MHGVRARDVRRRGGVARLQNCGAGSGVGGGGNASATASGADGPGSAEEVVVYGSRAVYGLALLPLAVAASAVRGHYGARRA